ncbi:hypothetical protein DIPPA_70106 [Diplonema papillatum]|nr:hypothetical protein DIPPA_50221 [Diplonema papillatum]KAJ9445425.1 hypothetical protein DIPPA_70106 [Diplonema papillatum]
MSSDDNAVPSDVEQATAALHSSQPGPLSGKGLSRQVVPPPSRVVPVPKTGRVLYAFSASQPEQMTVLAGQVVTLLGEGGPGGSWTRGVAKDGKSGWIPTSYVEVIVPEPAPQAVIVQAPPAHLLPRPATQQIVKGKGDWIKGNEVVGKGKGEWIKGGIDIAGNAGKGRNDWSKGGRGSKGDMSFTGDRSRGLLGPGDWDGSARSGKKGEDVWDSGKGDWHGKFGKGTSFGKKGDWEAQEWAVEEEWTKGKGWSSGEWVPGKAGKGSGMEMTSVGMWATPWSGEGDWSGKASKGDWSGHNQTWNSGGDWAGAWEGDWWNGNEPGKAGKNENWCGKGWKGESGISERDKMDTAWDDHQPESGEWTESADFEWEDDQQPPDLQVDESSKKEGREPRPQRVTYEPNRLVATGGISVTPATRRDWSRSLAQTKYRRYATRFMQLLKERGISNGNYDALLPSFSSDERYLQLADLSKELFKTRLDPEERCQRDRDRDRSKGQARDRKRRENSEEAATHLCQVVLQQYWDEEAFSLPPHLLPG